MAVYILIRKASESDREAVYVFGPDELTLGSLRVRKDSGAVELISPAPVSNPEFYFVRAGWKVLQHYERGEFPDKTCFAS
jgi:hypothetical protein